MTDCWHIPLIRVIKIWQEVETTWKDALLIASATNSEQAWRDLAAYQAILTTGRAIPPTNNKNDHEPTWDPKQVANILKRARSN